MSEQNANIRWKKDMKGVHFIAAILCTVMFVLGGCNPSIEDVERIMDPNKLAKVAVETKDEYVRRAAVKKLTDQALLAKVAVETKDEYVRRTAMERLTDQALLTKVAIEAKDWNARRAAVEKLTDQTLLAKVAMEDNDVNVHHPALKKLTDQTLLAKVAVETKDEYVRHTAMGKLTDQAVREKISAEIKDKEVRRDAVEAKHEEVRRDAVNKLTDQALLAKVAVEDKSQTVRRAAVEKLTDQAVLAKVAVEDRFADIRVVAISKLTDQNLLHQGFLIKRLEAESSAAVHDTIIKTLRERSTLREVALAAYQQIDREKALQRLRKDFRDPASDVVAAHNALSSRANAISGETDSNKLLELVLKGEFDVLCVAAAQQLSDQDALEHAALQATDREVLKIVLAKISSRDTINQIAVSATDRAMRLAAAQKSGSKSWQEIFNDASTPQMLSDAIAAASFLPYGRLWEAQQYLHQTCLKVIKGGNKSRIQEMVDLLERYGDIQLAEDYLNSGQPDLEKAGRTWALRHGYDVGTGSGSHRAAWGSSK